MRFSKTLVPNSITLLSMVVGFGAVTRAMQGELVLAAWLLCLGGLLDVLDGRAATILHATSEFGAALDSFSDLAVFGFAPSVVMYRAYFSSWGLPAIVLGCLPLLAAALRLTRFNLEDRAAGSSAYVGLTTPIAAGMLVGFVILTDGRHDPFQSDLAAVLTVAASLLMVSTIRYDTDEPFRPPALLAKWRGYWLITFLPAAALLPRYAVFVWTTAFATYGVLRSLVTFLLARLRVPSAGEDAPATADLSPGHGEPYPFDP